MDHQIAKLILFLCLVPCLALGQTAVKSDSTPSLTSSLLSDSSSSTSDTTDPSQLKNVEIEGYHIHQLSLPSHLNPDAQLPKYPSQQEPAKKVHRFSSGLLGKSPMAKAIISAANKLGHGQRLKRGIFSTLTGFGNVGQSMMGNLLGNGGGGGGSHSNNNNGNSMMTSGAVNLINSVTGGNNKDPDDDDSSSSPLSSSSSSSSSSTSSLLSAMATAPGKPKPYHFNDVELTAIQAVVALRDILGDILQRVGINIPNTLTSLITRSGGDSKLNTPSTNDQPPVYYTSNGLPSLSGASNALSSLAGLKTSGNVGLLLRGLALSLPLLIPMATQIRRMSSESSALASSAASALLPSASQFQNFPSSTFQTLQSLPFDPYYNQALHRRRGKRSVNSAEQSSESVPADSQSPVTSNTMAMTVPLFHQLQQQAHQRMAAEQIIRALQQLEEKYGRASSQQ